MASRRGNPVPVPSSMVSRYTTVWGDTLTTISASFGVDPRQVAAASGLANWHNLEPLPPGTQILMPFFPVPHRMIVASAKVGDPRGRPIDPRSPLSDPGAVNVTAQSQYLPMPIGI